MRLPSAASVVPGNGAAASGGNGVSGVRAGGSGVMRNGFRVYALAAVFLGLGILLACFLPPQALVVIVAVTVVVVGFLCMRC